ncbi:hypothetical protein MKW92_024990 [Papaver armeniacum]|nr:hypothetical protein MKW92_024990 [Papaver armeniacum]
MANPQIRCWFSQVELNLMASLKRFENYVYLMTDEGLQKLFSLSHYTDPPAGRGNSFVSAIEVCYFPVGSQGWSNSSRCSELDIQHILFPENSFVVFSIRKG